MNTLRDIIKNNEAKCEPLVQFLEGHGNGFFGTQEQRDWGGRSKSRVLAILACGKDLSSLVTSLEHTESLTASHYEIRQMMRQYNSLVQQLRADGNWNDPPAFVEL